MVPDRPAENSSPQPLPIVAANHAARRGGLHDLTAALDRSRRVSHGSRRHGSGFFTARGRSRSVATLATAAAAVAASIAATVVAAGVASAMAARLFAAEDASQQSAMTLLAAAIATGVARIAASSGLAARRLAGLLAASRFAASGLAAARLAATVAIKQTLQPLEQTAVTMATRVARIAARGRFAAAWLAAGGRFAAARLAAGGRFAAGRLAARSRFAAARLAAARGAAIAAAAVPAAQHPIEQLKAEALATHAGADDERSNKEFPFHLSNVSFVRTAVRASPAFARYCGATAQFAALHPLVGVLAGEPVEWLLSVGGEGGSSPAVQPWYRARSVEPFHRPDSTIRLPGATKRVVRHAILR